MEIKSINSFWELSKISAKLGTKSGFILASLYLFYLMVRMGISMIIEEPGFSFSSGIVFLIITGSVFGVIPSILIGICTGLVISSILWFLKGWLSAAFSLIIGFAVCIGFIVLGYYLSGLIWIDIIPKGVGFIGIASFSWNRPIPLIIYVLTGGYMSWKYSILLIDGNGDMNSRENKDADKVVLL